MSDEHVSAEAAAVAAVASSLGPDKLDKLDESLPLLDVIIQKKLTQITLLRELRASILHECGNHLDHAKARKWYLFALDEELQRLKASGVRVRNGKLVRWRIPTADDWRAEDILKQLRRLGTETLVDGTPSPYGVIDWSKG